MCDELARSIHPSILNSPCINIDTIGDRLLRRKTWPVGFRDGRSALPGADLVFGAVYSFLFWKNKL